MSSPQQERIQVLKHALDDEVHGLWISDEMAINILSCLDAIGYAKTESKPNDGKSDKPRVPRIPIK